MDSKQKLIKKIRSIMGRQPPGINEILQVMTDPEVSVLVREYLWTHEEKRGQCQSYIVMWERTLGCDLAEDHLDDHIHKTEDSWNGVPVHVMWARLKSPGEGSSLIETPEFESKAKKWSQATPSNGKDCE